MHCRKKIKDLANAVADEYDVLYSKDGRRLLKCENYSLTEYTVMEGTEVICNSAFEDRADLTEVVIPKSVITIAGGAFQDCARLRSVTSLNPEPPTCDTYAFDNVPIGACTLYVPKGSKEAYAEANLWHDFTKIVEI